jgi:hypothetical protein
VLWATGYLHSYPFLENELKLRSANFLYYPNLYKGVLWMGSDGDGLNSADQRLLYIGVHRRNVLTKFTFYLFLKCAGTQNLIYMFTYLDAEGILGSSIHNRNDSAA